MDSLGNLLGRKEYSEPPEVAAIKKYVQDEFQQNVSVMVRDRDIVLQVPSAALANALRLKSPDIKRQCNLTKRLTFRIG